MKERVLTLRRISVVPRLNPRSST